jgi:hypothetical protein
MELAVFEEPGKEWNEFASRYTDLIFYQSVWSDVLKRGLGGHPLYYVLKDGKTIVAGLPGVLFHFRLFKILYASIPYGNLIGDASAFPDFSALLDQEFRRRGFDQVRFTECPFSGSHRPSGFTALCAKSSVLDLTRFDKARRSEAYRSDVRRAIRKARTSGLSVGRALSREDAGAFYRLYLSSMERNRTGAKYPLQWFYALYDILVAPGRADILLAQRENRSLAGVVTVYSPAVCHYLHNGSEDASLEYRPNDLLIDSIIEKALEDGATMLDFMGSDRNDVSLLRFKEKWGSRSSDIYTFTKDYHPFKARCFEWGKRVFSSPWGRRVRRVATGGHC